MLILQRRAGESIQIGDDIEISVLTVEGGRVRLAITAPTEVTILRRELIEAQAANQDSAMEQTTPSELFAILEEVLPDQGAHPAVQPKPVVPFSSLRQREKQNRPQQKGGDSK